MRNVRVKLNFDNLLHIEESVPPKAWFMVDSKSLDTISDLEKEIIQKFSLDWLDNIDLYSEGCFLPKWESIRILRDNDVLRFALALLALLNLKLPKTLSKSKMFVRGK